MLKAFFKKYSLSLVCCFYSMVVALFWLALRPCWSGISKVLGAESNPSFFVMELPLIFCIFMWLAFAYAIAAMIFLTNKKLHKFISLGISFVFTIITVVIVVMGAKDYILFVLPNFFTWLCVSVLLILFAALLFLPISSNCTKCKIAKSVLLSVAILSTVLFGFEIRANYITHEAVVYAVEDNYQIVFSTNDYSTAWVEVGNQTYYDLYAGSMSSSDIVHKVEVPQKVLDAAGGYKIFAQKIIYRGPFGGYKGKILSKQYNFRGADTSDGLQYYSIADVHGALNGATNAASHFAAKMDFLVIAGDIYSMIDSHYDANFVNVLAHNITKGEFPVIYARGNHEVKGAYAERLHKYVGSKNQKFFYTVEMDDIFAVVLDMGEDHEDDWWEFYGTAQFDFYRKEQTDFLSDIEQNTDLSGFRYKLAVCHIPVVFVNNRKDHEAFKNEWTDILNKLDIDMCISGHQHTLYPFVPTQQIVPKIDLTYNTAYGNGTYKGYLTGANFANILVSRRADTQLGAEASGMSKFIGLYTEVNFTTLKQTSSYTNAAGSKVSVVHPFANINFGTEIVTDLRTR